MADPNLTEFYSRVRRIEKARAKGFGFEAAGTLGRSFYHKQGSSRHGWLKPLILLMVGFFGLKAVIVHNVGSEVYQARVAGMEEGEQFARLGAWIMQADPVTLELASRIDQLMLRVTP